MRGGAILLAAGFSRRFGSDKRRHPLADGQPLLLHSVRLYASAFPRLIVVLRPEDDDLAAAVAEQSVSAVAEQSASAAAEQLDAGITVVRCSDAHLGMGHSLACGARAAGGWDYVFVALADMAWVRPDTLEALRLAMESRTDTLIRPSYRGTPGHPVGFPVTRIAELAALEGDDGARGIVTAHGDRVVTLDVDDPGVLEDLDRPP